LLYGISESQSCRLSQIARALKEPIALKKTIERLGRGVGHFSQEEALLDNYNALVKPQVNHNSVFILDNSDLVKPYSVAMEGLAIVRDGSTGELKPGYHTLEIAVLSNRFRAPIPVYDRLYSACEEGFVSEDDEILAGLRYIRKTFGNQGVRTLDRGYDALIYYEYFLKAKEQFIIRAKKNRDVKYKGKTINILKLAKCFKGKYRLDFQGKKGEKINCKLTAIPISLPKYPNIPLSLVVVYGFGKDPMMLITNLKLEDKRLPTIVTKVYLMRWRIEEHFRFRKMQYDLEGFRVRSLNAIRTLHRLTAFLAGYVSMLSEKRDNSLFVAQLIKASKRIFEFKPKKKPFLNYAIADGIAAVLQKSTTAIRCLLLPPHPSPQLLFPGFALLG
jgi:hypothetical protein